MSFNWASLTDPSIPAEVPVEVETAAPQPAAAVASRVGTESRHGVKARYDNALTTPENQRLWWASDYLSAKSANSFQVRRTLRMRSRYEVANNPFLFGVVHSNADDLIDTGPTLQVYTSDDTYNRIVEAAWREWCEEVELTEKLRTTKLAKTVDGEGFLVLKTVEDLESPVKLYPCDVEADQVTTPAPSNLGELWVDGLTLHPTTGKPTHYHCLKHHPGDYFFPDLNPLAVEKLQARHVVHWFTQSRPGQVRGVPTFTPSLDLFVELRSFRRAVLGAAEIAADYAAVIEQDREVGAHDTDDDADAEYQPFSRVPTARKSMTMLPPGAKMAQFKSENPSTTYEMFQEKCLGEACRPLSYPLNLALGTSQKFNFSSAKLDHINYRHALSIERDICAKSVLEKIFRAWFEEAVLSGAIPAYKGGWRVPKHEWHWPGFEPIDPVSDAQADHERLSNGTDTYQRFWARRGLDWKDVFRQQAEEQQEIESLGLQFGEPASKTISQTEDLTDDGRADSPNKAVAHRRLWKKYQAAKSALVRAGEWKEDEHPRADDGKFGSGGGGGGSGKGDAGDRRERNEEHAEHHERWKDDDEYTAKERAKEDASRQDQREAEDDEVAGEREDEAADHNDAVEAHNAKFDKTEARHNDELEKLESKREKEDAKIERTRAKEDAEHARADAKDDKNRDAVVTRREKEDEKTKREREKEDKTRAREQAAEVKELEKKQKEELDKADDADKAAARDRHEDERYALADTHANADEEVAAKREEEDAERDEARQKEDDELDNATNALAEAREEREAAREEEDAKRAAERKAEDAEIDARHKKEMDELGAAAAELGRQDEQRKARYEAEDAKRAAERKAEDVEIAQQREDEDAETYHERRDEYDDAHETYYGRDLHKRYGGREARSESHRRNRIRGGQWNESDHPRGDDGKFGVGTNHAEEARKAHQEADQHAADHKKAKDDGEEEAAKAHKDAEKARRKVAQAHEEIDRKQKEHAAEVERAKESARKEHEEKLADATKKAEDAKRNAAEVRERNAGSKERLAELKRKLAESKKREKDAKSGAGHNLRAKKDDEGHEHGEDGKFAPKGEGGSSGKKDAPKGEHPEPSSDHKKPAEKTDSGHANDSSKSLKARAKKLAARIKAHGQKAVAVAKRVAEAAKHAAFAATWKVMQLGIHPQDIGDDVTDYSKIINAKGTGDWLSASAGAAEPAGRPASRGVRAHLGVSGGFAATVASHVLAFGLTKLKEAIARRRERKAREAAAEKDAKSSLYEPNWISAAGDASDHVLAARAAAVAKVLGAFYAEMGCPDDVLPTKAEVLDWLRTRAKDKSDDTAQAAGGSHVH